MSLILLADDDDILREVVRAQLEADGHELITAENGAQALDHLNRCMPDLVILDSIMPVLGGTEVLATMRAQEGMRQIPVMMLTGCKGPDEAENALKAGANEYMEKPFRPDGLSQRVTTLLSTLHAANI